MATPTKTTLNSKLPVVSKIAFCSSAGKGMATKIFTGENGKFTKKVGFKQNSKTYPFQIQYRQRSRYTDANSKRVGAQWTNWSKWKNAVAVSGIPAEATETQKPVNKWLKANKGVNKKGTYQTFFTMTNYLIPDTYDAREFQFRIRTINKAKAKHGNWTMQTLSVFKRAAVVDETIITASDGGMKVKFNYIWDRTANIKVNSIKDADGRELLRKAFTAGVQAAYLTAETTPQPREGYQAGMIEIPMKKLKRRIGVNEALTLDIKFTTVDGAPTALSSGTVIEPRTDIPITINRTWDEETGLLTVTATNDSQITLANIGANISYTYNGKAYSAAAVSAEKHLEAGKTSTFCFYPPIGIPLTLNVKEENILDFKDSEEPITFTVAAKGYRLNKIDSTALCGVAWGNATYTVSSEPIYETSLPYGRENNIIFYGEGCTNSINFTATLIDKENCYGGSYGRKLAWDSIRNNQGVYYFRTNKGEMYQVGITAVSLSHESKDIYSLSVDMMEVV